MIILKNMENKKASLPEIKSLLQAYCEAPSTIPKEAEGVIMSYYGDEINQLEGILPTDERQKSTSILKNFYERAFDLGLRKNQVWMLSRASWIDQTKRKSGENFSNLAGVLMLDIANLSGANAVSEENGDKLIATVAQSITEYLSNLPENEKNKYQFIPCRYAGDSFVIAVIQSKEEQANGQDLERYLKEIEAAIGKKQARYKINGKEETKGIKLKPGETKSIRVPEEEIKREIFLWALNRGSVLDINEIDLIMAVFNNDAEKIRKYLKENRRLEKDYQTEALSLMNDLAQKHSELAPPLYLANLLDQKANDGNHTRLISVLRFVEQSLYDPLLGEMVLSFDDFKSHLERREFSQVFGIEMRFVKEINDHFSMVVADEVIRELYGFIKSLIGEDILESVRIYRRGGSFFIGVKSGAALPAEVNARLGNLKNFSLRKILGQTVDLEIPLGLYQWENPNIKDLGNFIDGCDQSWYKNISFPPNIKSAIETGATISLPEINQENFWQQLTLDNLYKLFFGSQKRGKGRREKILFF
jgi:GGDEF domain-containing protein